ncbi:MAG: TatD family hydrolase [Armatimonadetes bacterium]|nr:TatD family hydrolase [Armatimonadota bacterium]
MTYIVDSHAHLNDRQFRNDIDGAVERAAEAGVKKIICPGFDIPSSRRAVQIAERYGGVWAAVGIHPHDAAKMNAGALAEIRELAQHPKVVALGEMGLDFYRDLSPRPVQEEAFRAQLALAGELGLPVIIHDRDAGPSALRVILDVGTPAAGGVMHCFSGDVDYALKVVELGFHIGIAGPVTFGKNETLRAVVRRVPEDRLLVETDAPYLTPEPFRSRRRNEPALVRVVAEKVAEVKNRTLDDIAQMTSANAESLFGLDRGSSP